MKILIVDDDKAILRVLARTLKDHNLTAVTTAAEGIERVFQSEQKFDVVISDYEIGKENGLVMLANIREISPETKFILMTGSAGEFCGEKNNFLAGFLRKPFEINEIRELLKKLQGGN